MISEYSFIRSFPQSKHDRGFSLVEVMISLTILMMVLFIGNLAYRTYAVYWHKELGSFDQQVSELKGISNIHDIIRNIKPIVFRGGEAGGYFYFEGGDSLIRAVITESVGDSDAAAAFELIVNNNKAGGVDILYREFPITQSPLLDVSQIGEYGEFITILSGLQDVRFEYYGWPSYADFTASERNDNSFTSNSKAWFGLYSGQDTLISPEVVKLRIKKDDSWSELLIPISGFLHKDLLQFVGADS